MGSPANIFAIEGRSLLARMGWRALPLHLVLIAAFGVFLPWSKGIEFLDPVMLAAYACLGVVFAAPAAGQSFIERPKSMGQAIARIGIAVVYGEIMALAMLAAGLITVYLRHPLLPIAPDVIGLAGANAFGLACSFALAAISGWIAMRFSPGASRLAMRLIFLALLLVFFFRSRWLPDFAVTGTAVSLAAGLAAIWAIRGELHNSMA
jgi:hypothetical protein